MKVEATSSLKILYCLKLLSVVDRLVNLDIQNIFRMVARRLGDRCMGDGS